MRCDFTVQFSHPVDRVWPYLSEPEKWLEWIPALVERTRIDDGPFGPGTKWKSVDRIGPLRVQFTEELIEFEPKRRVSFKQSSPWNSSGAYQLESEGDDNTLVHVRFEGELSGKIRWTDLMPDSRATSIMRKDMERLGVYLDSITDG